MIENISVVMIGFGRGPKSGAQIKEPKSIKMLISLIFVCEGSDNKEIITAVFPRGSEKRKSSNDEISGRGRKLRRPTALC